MIALYYDLLQLLEHESFVNGQRKLHLDHSRSDFRAIFRSEQRDIESWLFPISAGPNVSTQRADYRTSD